MTLELEVLVILHALSSLDSGFKRQLLLKMNADLKWCHVLN